jgi:hypothetical protein
VVGDFHFNLAEIQYIIAPKSEHDSIASYFPSYHFAFIDIEDIQNLKYKMKEPCTLNIIVRKLTNSFHEIHEEHLFNIHCSFQNRYLLEDTITSLQNFGNVSNVYESYDDQDIIDTNHLLYQMFENKYDPDHDDECQILYQLEEEIRIMESYFSDEIINTFERQPEERIENSNCVLTLDSPFDHYPLQLIQEILQKMIHKHSGYCRIIN